VNQLYLRSNQQFEDCFAMLEVSTVLIPLKSCVGINVEKPLSLDQISLAKPSVRPRNSFIDQNHSNESPWVLTGTAYATRTTNRKLALLVFEWQVGSRPCTVVLTSILPLHLPSTGLPYNFLKVFIPEIGFLVFGKSVSARVILSLASIQVYDFVKFN